MAGIEPTNRVAVIRLISGPPLGCRVCGWSRCWLLAGRTPRGNLGRTRPGSPDGPANADKRPLVRSTSWRADPPPGRLGIGLNGPLWRLLRPRTQLAGRASRLTRAC